MNFIPNTEFAAAQSQVLDKRSSGSRCLLLLLRVLQSVSLYSLFLAVHFCLYPSQFVSFPDGQSYQECTEMDACTDSV